MAWFELVAAPLLIAFGGFVVWYLQSRLEKVHELERNLQEERRAVYSNILEPYIRLFASLKDPDAQAGAAAQLLTYEYRKMAFDLNLVGADSVVRAYNKMMQFAFSSAGTQTTPKR